jgi:putative tryptophan/tyrosine transport system substrate-binding protein
VSAAPVRDTAEIEQVIARLAQQPGSGLIAAADPFVIFHRDAILKPAKMHRVPVISSYRQFVLEGSLISYGPDPSDIFRRTGSYVDRILRGEKPADLAVQSPIKFELTVNMITAKALGLTVQDSFLLLADEVIE